MKTILSLSLVLALLSFVTADSSKNIIKTYKYTVLYQKVNGKLTGKYTSRFTSSGKLRAQGNLLNGKHVGEWVVYDSLENVITKRVYNKQHQFVQTFPVSLKYDTLALAKNSDNIIPYAKVKEGNVIWSKRLWRTIPIENNETLFKNAQLSSTIIGLAKNNEIQTYHASDDQFGLPISFKEANYRLEPVVAYKIKEDNYFNTATQSMETRIIGICPVIQTENTTRDLAWFYYPQLRSSLGKIPFQGTKQSLENIFSTRDFHSIITKESNIKNKALIDYQFKKGKTLAGERERIEIELIEREHDFWVENL